MPDLAARVRRLLSLIPYVLKHQGVALSELSEVFDIPQDQLLKDLHLIFMCGQPDYSPADLIEVDIDDDRVFIRMADYFSRPLRFTPSELSGLYMACGALVKLSGLPSSPALLSAMKKIEKVLDMSLPAEVNIEESVEVRPLSPEHRILGKLSSAADRRRVVEMEYYTYGRDELTRRKVHPLSLEFGMGHWYLRAWDEKRGKVRIFRVDRVKDLRVTRKTFEPVPEEGTGESGPYGAAEKGEIEVRLRFSPSLAGWAGEQRLFSRVEEEGDGVSCILYTDNLSWVERELLKYGPQVEVISPPELKRRLGDRARRLLSIYEDEV
ncbi:MAG: WYL domain-containing protein [Actinomycetota bacterium]|nr:WYL domain-containing protein [Actinomycetota bacterium]